MRVTDGGLNGSASLSVRLGNAGSYPVPAGVPVVIYNANPATSQAPVVGRAVLPRALPSNDFLDLIITPTLPLSQLSTTVWIVADDDGTGKTSITDFDRSNNTIGAQLNTLANALAVSVSTDKPVYNEADVAQFTATILNNGSFPRDAQVRFTVLDTNAQSVAVLPLPAPLNVVAGASAQVMLTWPATGVLAGPYQIKAELLNSAAATGGTGATRVVDASAVAPFTITASQSTQLAAHISTDRSSYSTAQTVQITSQLNNSTSNTPLQNLLLTTEVLTPSGQAVRSFTETLAQLTPLALRQYTYAVPATGLAPGLYSARLRISPGGLLGTVLVEQSTAFAVQSTSQSGVGVTGQLLATPSTTPLGQPVALRLTLSNAGNGALSNATVRVRVLDPVTGNVFTTYTQSGFSLNVGAAQALSWSWPSTGVAGSTVIAAATLEITSGKEIALAQSPIQLTAAPAQLPLTGTVSATPRNVSAGTSEQFVYSVQNANPSAVQATLTLTVSAIVSSPVTLPTGATPSAIAQWVYPQTLGAGTSYAGNQAWTTVGPAGTTYRVTLTAATATATATTTTTVTTTASPTPYTLSSDTFTIAQPALQITAAQSAATTPRLLMLVSCSPSDDTTQAQNPACDEAKAQAVRDYFSALGVTGLAVNATVVTSGAEFETLLRCGNYSAYALSGGTSKLSSQAVGELREALERGAGLWLDGAQTSRDAMLHDLAGIKLQGTLSTQGQLVTFTTGLSPVSLYPAGSLSTLGKPARYSLQGGTAQANFGTDPAVVTRTSGLGHTLVTAFNMATLMRQPQATADAQLADLVRRSLAYLSPPLAHTSVPGAPQTLGIVLTNTGTQAGNVAVQATLPPGVLLLDSQPAASPATSSNVVNWNITVAAAQSLTLAVQLSASQASAYTIPVTIQASAVNSAVNSTTPQTLNLRLNVNSVQTLTDSAISALASIKPSPAAQANAANRARSAVASAVGLMGQARYSESLVQWLSASDELRSVASLDTSVARQALSIATQAAQRQLCTQWACITGSLGFTVNGAEAKEVPVLATIVGRRIIYNNCPAQIKDIPVTASWVNRSTGASVQNLWDNLTIPGNNNHRRDNGWQAQGTQNDIVDVLLTAQWQANTLHLARDAFTLVVLPPKLSGTLSVNPTHAKANANVSISSKVTNTGAMASNIPVVLSVTDINNGKVLWTQTQTLTLNPGESNNANTNWFISASASASASSTGPVRITLSATVAGSVQTLASTAFTIDK